jgi:predicted metalloprotease with PDZ domain
MYKAFSFLLFAAILAGGASGQTPNGNPQREEERGSQIQKDRTACFVQAEAAERARRDLLLAMQQHGVQLGAAFQTLQNEGRELERQARQHAQELKNMVAQIQALGFPPASVSYLGVGVEEIDSARAKELKLKEERGVEIRRVEPDSPAEKAGLKEHDVVLEYNGQPVEGVESFTRMVRETPVGRTAKLLISRDGNTQTVTAVIGRRPALPGRPPYAFTMPPIPPIDIPRPVMTLRAARLGLEIESISGQLADFFGVKEGALVRSVEKDSPAEKAGLKAGDVIVKAAGETIASARDLTQALRSGSDRKTVPVQVVRNKKEMTLNLELPERNRSQNRGEGVRIRQDRF